MSLLAHVQANTSAFPPISLLVIGSIAVGIAQLAILHRALRQ